MVHVGWTQLKKAILILLFTIPWIRSFDRKRTRNFASRLSLLSAMILMQPCSLRSLFEVEKSSDIVLQFLSEQLGLEDVSQKPSSRSGPKRKDVLGQRAVARLGKVVGKRIVDVLGAVLLVFTLTPVAVLIAFIVALDVGFPVIFWQQRPGLYGRPFKLYKFRTMRAPHDRHKKRIPDAQRSSAIGQLIRRIRLDELPQLYNVLKTCR
jgi:hypothetical protein